MFSFIKNKVYLFTRMYFKRAKNIKQIDKFKLTFRKWVRKLNLSSDQGCHIFEAQGHTKRNTWLRMPHVPFRVPLKKIVPYRTHYGSPKSRTHFIILRKN